MSDERDFAAEADMFYDQLKAWGEALEARVAALEEKLADLARIATGKN